MNAIPVLITETPQRPKEGEIIGPQDELDPLRLAVLKDAGYVHRVVTVDAFFKHVLPPLRKTFRDNNTVEEVLKRLKLGPEPVFTGEDWGNIVKRKGQNMKERDIYAGFDDIAKAIEVAVKDLKLPNGLAPVTKYQDAPKKAPVSLKRTAAHIPDGYFILRDKQEPGNLDHWIDIAVVGEFKRRNSREDLNKDMLQMLWDLHHITREDERRRSVLGFTIEKKEMRLWYIGRSDICISQPFDIVKNPLRLVHFFLCCLYSRPYRLGWDTSMEYVNAAKSDNGKSHLLITVHSHDLQSKVVYKTLQLLSNVGTEAIRGRGTRAWRVQGLTKNGEPLPKRSTNVLKDSWIDSDREREAPMVARIRADGEKLPPEFNEVLQKSLLTSDMYGDVWICPDDEDDDGLQPFVDQTFRQDVRDLIHPPGAGAKLLEFQKPAIMDKSEAHLSHLQSQAAGNENSVHRRKEPDRGLVVHAPRTHTRTVFLEDCRPIHEERSLKRALRALVEACGALRVLHRAGWVHRDISAGNILLWGDKVKLADLEYAKEFKGMKTVAEIQAAPLPHPVRTGTPNYISVEVQQRAFCFRPKNPIPTPVALAGESNWSPALLKQQGSSQSTRDSNHQATAEQSDPMNRILWQYHPLNDVESLGWLFNQLTYNRDVYFSRKPYPDEAVECPEGDEPPTERAARIKRQSDAVDVLSYDGVYRFPYLLVDEHEAMTNIVTNLHPILKSQERGPISVAWGIREVRSIITSEYARAEQDPSTITNTVSGLALNMLAETIYKVMLSLEMDNYLVCIRPLEPELHKIRKAETAQAPGPDEAGPSGDTDNAPPAPDRKGKRKQLEPDSDSEGADGGHSSPIAAKVQRKKAQKKKKAKKA